MERKPCLDLYDIRRSTLFSDIECIECAYSQGTCGNALVVLDAMRDRGNDMSIPVLTFIPDRTMNASQCPGMFPGAHYLRATGQESALVWENKVDADYAMRVGK